MTSLAASIRRRLGGATFMRAAGLIMLGTGAGQAITILSSPIITRLYGPAEFGAFGVATSLLGVLAAVACLGYEFAIPLPADEADAANVTILCVLIALVVSLVVAVVLAVAGGPLLGALGADDLRPLVLLLALGTFTAGVGLAFTASAIHARAYREMAINRVASSALTVVSQVLLAFLGAGTPGLLLGFVGGQGLGALRLAWVSVRRRIEAFRQVSRRGMAAAARRYRRFPLLSAPSNVLNSLTLQLPLLMVAAVFGVAVGGQFVLAQRIIALPASLVAQSVGQAFLAESAEVARTRPAELASFFRRTSRGLAVAALPPVAVVAVASPFVFPFAFGAEWADAGIYAALLAPMYYLQFVANPTAQVLDVLERQDLLLIRSILRIAVLGAVFLGIVAFGVPPFVAVAAVSAAGSLAYLVSALFAWRAVAAHTRRLNEPTT